MVWGEKRGVDDLLQRVRENDIQSMCIMRSRNFQDAQAQALGTALAENTSLTELLASGHKIGAEGALALGAALAGNTTLRRIAVGDTDFGDEGVQALVDGGLARNSSLEALDLEFKSLATVTHISQLLLAPTCTLRELNLSRNRLDDAAALTLANTLEKNQTLLVLNLASNCIGAEGSAPLAAALRTCPLKRLDLSGNPIGDTGAAAIFREDSDLSPASSSRGLTLEALVLSKCGCGRLASSSAGAFLRGNRSLTTLDLGGNALGAAGAAALATGLETNRTLTTLLLAETGIGDDGAVFLATALAPPGRGAASSGGSGVPVVNSLGEAPQVLGESALRSLDVASCGVCGRGAAALLTAGLLTTLRLFDNAVGDAGAQEVAAALEANGTVVSLDLGANKLSGKGVVPLLDVAAGHSSLRTLELGGNQVDAAAEAAIDACRRGGLLDVAFRAAVQAPEEVPFS